MVKALSALLDRLPKLRLDPDYPIPKSRASCCGDRRKSMYALIDARHIREGHYDRT